MSWGFAAKVAYSLSSDYLQDVSTFYLAFKLVPGQGYIWLGHKIPGSATWELKKRSHQLWELLAESIRNKDGNPLEELGWKNTGSVNTCG